MNADLLEEETVPLSLTRKQRSPTRHKRPQSKSCCTPHLSAFIGVHRRLPKDWGLDSISFLAFAETGQ
jgi:hypothetical protein